ncbi:MAG: MmgE/PrpD family protein [Deltaproteobacteria bacterium]|nr:MmgE/PrpD family protein [Deltaproteobacteria bacterium]
MRTYAEQFGDFTTNLEFENIPSVIIDIVKLHLLDTMGVCFACSTLPYSQILVNILKEEGGVPESTVISYGYKLTSRNAAFINGSLAHGYNFDDTHIQAIVHPTAIIMPTVFSMGEKERINGKTALVAVTAGLEIICRLGLAAPQMVQRGIDPNPACGVFGATAAAGKILALSPDQIATAMGIAGVMSSGDMEWESDGSLSWCVQAGLAAQNGILAAKMAKLGYTGPHTILEGNQGFYISFAGKGNYDLKILNEGLNKSWETANIVFKAYPACQGAQAYIDCVLMLGKEHGIDPNNIQEIECKVGELIGKRLCEPPEVKVTPPNPDIAQVSIPYTIAAAIIEGKVGIPEVSGDKIKDPHILNLAKKVKHIVDPAYDEGMAIRAWVRIRMKDGNEYVKEVNTPKGSIENPFEEKDVRDKFINNATMVLPGDQALELAENVMKLDSVNDISDLMILCKRKN